ncbi:MAG: Isoquinoline 1-oxidoreductase subunit [Myxococcota bacterium]
MRRKTIMMTAGLAGVGLLLAVTATQAALSGEDAGSAEGGAAGSAGSAGSADGAGPAVTLTPPGSIAMKNEAKRSEALFVEAAKVLMHPRCVNCHPAGDRPLQGEAGKLHEPPVTRGADGHGVIGMKCQTCHYGANFDPGRVPGVDNWHLSPSDFAWEGKSAGEICEQIKDPARNGNRSLADIEKHMAEDHFIEWSWAPGAGRQPAPGDHDTFAALISEWIKTGAVCPKP